jgi:hypothetical protein
MISPGQQMLVLFMVIIMFRLAIFKNGILISNDVIYQGVLEGVGNWTFFDIYL